MATEKPQLEGDSDWKNRYYEVLEELRASEQHWQESERILQQLVSQLSQTVDIYDQSLSAKLDQLQAAFQQGENITDLQLLVAEISNRINELEKQKKKSSSQSHPARIFVEILDKIDLPETLEREYRQLKKNLKGLRLYDDDSEVSAEFLNIVQRLLQDDRELPEPENRKQKLLNRILAREVKNEQQRLEGEEKKAGEVPQRFIAPAVGDLLLQLSIRLPDEVKRRLNFNALKKHTNKARRRKDLIPIIDVIAQQIESAYQPEEQPTVELEIDSYDEIYVAVREILRNMAPPADLCEQVATLEKLLEQKPESIDSLVHCLNQLAAIVAEICDRLATQRIEMNDIVIRLSDQLKQLGADIQKTSTLCTEQVSADTETVDELQLLLAGLSEQAGQLEELPASLRNSLEQSRPRIQNDTLTGLPDRLAYEERLSIEVARCRRYNTCLSILVCDVDNISDINENYGLASGDRVLQVLAGLLDQQIRETDFIARYGSDEFVILMTETTQEGAVKVADKLCEKIASSPFHFHDVNIAVTISIGLTEYRADDLISAMFERAHTAMFKSKQAGRNSVTVADE